MVHVFLTEALPSFPAVRRLRWEQGNAAGDARQSHQEWRDGEV